MNESSAYTIFCCISGRGFYVMWKHKYNVEIHRYGKNRKME